MPRYIIEREIPGAGNLSPADLQAVSQKSCGIIRDLGPALQWGQSFVTDDKVYCLYLAPNEEIVRGHARQGGFPAAEATTTPRHAKSRSGPSPASRHGRHAKVLDTVETRDRIP